MRWTERDTHITYALLGELLHSADRTFSELLGQARRRPPLRRFAAEQLRYRLGRALADLRRAGIAVRRRESRRGERLFRILLPRSRFRV